MLISMFSATFAATYWATKVVKSAGAALFCPDIWALSQVARRSSLQTCSFTFNGLVAKTASPRVNCPAAVEKPQSSFAWMAAPENFRRTALLWTFCNTLT